MLRLILISFFNMIFLSSFAQPGEGSIFGGIMYKTSGIGLAFQNKSETTRGFGRQIDVDFASYHHPQEVKTFNSEVNNPTPYVYGKINKAAILKMGYSVSYKISHFSDAQRVGIDVIAGGGFIAGFLKPVYINMIYPDVLGYETVVSEKYDPYKHTDKTRIAGYSDGRLGWSELSTKLGLHLQAGAGFNWGYYTNFPKRLEAGFFLEYFSTGLPVMAITKNKILQEGVYVKLFLGRHNAKN
jgi:hypothetical protein